MKSKASLTYKSNNNVNRLSYNQFEMIGARMNPIMPRNYNASERAQLRDFEKQFLVRKESQYTYMAK